MAGESSEEKPEPRAPPQSFGAQAAAEDAPPRRKVTLGDVHKQMPALDELKGIVRYKGPVSEQTVLKQAATNSELQKAVEDGDADKVDALLRYGVAKKCVNVNAPLWPKRERLLHLAARADRRDICQLLLEARAELDAEEITDGRTPLHDACAAGSYDVVELLLDKRARLEDANFTGLRPLHWAAISGAADVVDLLLDRRAQLEAVSGDTRQALHHAASGGHAEVLRLLCKRGARPDAETAGGQRALRLACLAGDVEGVIALLDAGALGALEDFGEKAPLRGLRGSPIQDLVRQVEALRLLRDEAEEMADMGQGEDAKEAFAKVVEDFKSLGLELSAASAEQDARNCGCWAEPE